jgi:transcriptional regulator with PAS, ATPase and Fis domain
MRDIRLAINAGAQAQTGKVENPPDILWFQGMPAVIASMAMKNVMRFVEQVANSSVAVLITGESGTGKELVARAVHEYSRRSAKPWIDINCAALPDHLLESELFGYEKGAFSGADAPKPGLFELASQGTLFLDEIAELSSKSQSKLLRVLDGYPYYRLGGTRKVEVNMRIVAATNADLESQVRSGRFRADLYHRLNQVCVTVPPLRHRTEDIAPLAQFFLANERAGLTLTADAVASLTRYQWPGNVRELRSLMARLAMTVKGHEIRREDLPAELRSISVEEDMPSSYSLDKLEQEVILHALEQADGRRKEAAELLGISQRTLMRRLKTYGTIPTRNLVCGGLECN